ncbi:MAG: hypothetical protein KJZ64_01840 [Sphingomonadaceae bacterium]|nr:hypothetical protein [Sphingomonadaceae bacterium]
MQRLLLTAMSLAMLCLAAPRQAVAAEWSNAADQLVSAAISGNMREPADRRNLVQAALTYCDEVEIAFPRNSPADDRWLDGEIAAGGERAGRTLMSAEFGRRKAQAFVRDCKSSAIGYLNDGHEHRTIAIIALAKAFADFDTDTEYYATSNGVNADRFSFLFIDTIADSLINASLYEAAQSNR